MLLCCRHPLPYDGFPVPCHSISTMLCFSIAVRRRSPSSDCCIIVINPPVPVAKASPSLLLAGYLSLDANNRVRLLADRRVPVVPSWRHCTCSFSSAVVRRSLAVIEISSVSCYPASPSVLCSDLLVYHPKVQDSIFSTYPFRLRIIENLTIQ
jgi:hypothetical protein